MSTKNLSYYQMDSQNPVALKYFETENYQWDVSGIGGVATFLFLLCTCRVNVVSGILLAVLPYTSALLCSHSLIE